MNPSGASSQTPNNIRKKVGPAVWLLVLLWDSMPADWTGDTFLYAASGNVISDAKFAERLEVSQRTIAKWRSRLRAAVKALEQKPPLTMPAASRWLQ
jgi:hypothetical protein